MRGRLLQILQDGNNRSIWLEHALSFKKRGNDLQVGLSPQLQRAGPLTRFKQAKLPPSELGGKLSSAVACQWVQMPEMQPQ